MAKMLEGITVIDASQLLPGPYCTMLLSDMGAEIIKIEPPETGEGGRNIPDLFNVVNRNKKSISLNLKSEKGREILYKMVEQSEVFLEGFRPGVAEKLGVDYNKLSSKNPKIVYCSISGYGQDGPYIRRPGHDINYQAISGLLNLNKDNEQNPIQPKMPIVDMLSGLFATIGILTAIIEVKVNKGLGQNIDISMLDGLISCMTLPIIRTMREGENISYDPGYGSFQTKDNRFITLGIYYEDWFWDRMCRAIGMDDLANMKFGERKKKKKILSNRLKKIFLSRNLEEWLNTLEKADVPATPVNTISDAIDDEQIKFRSLIKGIKKSSGYEISSINCPIKFSNYTYKDGSNVPELGESTEQILKNIGYLSKAISQMQKDKII